MVVISFYTRLIDKLFPLSHWLWFQSGGLLSNTAENSCRRNEFPNVKNGMGTIHWTQIRKLRSFSRDMLFQVIVYPTWVLKIMQVVFRIHLCYFDKGSHWDILVTWNLLITNTPYRVYHILHLLGSYHDALLLSWVLQKYEWHVYRGVLVIIILYEH